MSRTARRVGGALGIAHAVLLLGGFAFVISDDALMETPDADFASYFVDGPMAQVLGGGYVEALGFLCFLPFAAALAATLRSPVADPVAVPTVVSAAVAYVTLTLSPGLAAGGAAVWLGHHGTTDLPVLRGLVALRTFTYFTSLMVFGLFLAAVAVAVLTARSQPRWMGITAAGAALALLAGVPLQQVEIPSLLGLVWVVAVSVRMLRSPEPASTGSRPVAAA
ncbi:MAG: DUF4386 family protein [Actinomycetota bacterium]|nr:DUF4386 family protein [Actinomycetota bacterium]